VKPEEGADCHEVQMLTGEVLRVESSCAKRLFDFIHERHPEIPIVESRCP
jgi:hypothetical protein